MQRQLAISLGLALALPLIALRGWIALQRDDALPPDDGDLRPPPAAVAQHDDGFAQLAEAARTAKLPYGAESWDRVHAFRAGTRGSDEWIAQRVAQNAEALALVRAGIAAPRLRLPSERESARALERIAPLVALAGAQARLRERAGDPSGAIELASLGVRAAQRIAGADGAGLAAVALAGNLAVASLSDLDGIVRAARMTPDLAREVAALLEASRWSPETWRSIWAHEYVRAESHLAEVPGAARADAALASGVPTWAVFWVPLDYLWQPNRTRAALAELYRDQQRKSALVCSEARLTPLDAAQPVLRPRLGRLLAHNVVGELIIEHAPPFDDAQRRRCHVESAISLVQALAAVKAHWDAHGALPDQLGELVPRYLPALPLDPFDGQPIRYSRADALLSSVGDDLVPAKTVGAAPRLSDAAEPALSLVF
jgi:hypothetical protein